MVAETMLFSLTVNRKETVVIGAIEKMGESVAVLARLRFRLLSLVVMGGNVRVPLLMARPKYALFKACFLTGLDLVNRSAQIQMVP